MRARTTWIVLGLLWLASGVDAGWFGRSDRLPTPSSPILGHKAPESHKPGTTQRHPAKYQRYNWGRREKLFIGLKEAHFPHSVFQR